jgi:CPA1 family monovalent cation:H+ antiporter
MPFEAAFLVGAITAATDPVAIVAILARLHMPHRLRTLIEGESLLNDGTGLVLVALGVEAMTHGFDPWRATALFALTILVSVAVGAAAGFLAALLLRAVRQLAVAFGVSLVLAYGTFALSAAIGVSGVIATVIAAATLGTNVRRNRSDAIVARRLDRAWSLVAILLSAVTFLSIGAVIDVPSLGGSAGGILAGVLAVVAARALIVYVPSWLARPSLPSGWAHVLFWSGLRGAIAFAAALALPASVPDRLRIQEIAFGIVLVTLIVQGGTAPLVVRAALGPRETRTD